MLHSVILAGLTRTVLNRVLILLVGPITGCPKTLLPKAPQLADSTRVNSSSLPVHKQNLFAQTAEKVRHPASFNRERVHSGAARKGSPSADAGS
jgi:hypothetical protein